MYNTFLKSTFKGPSNDGLVETNSQLLQKLCSKQSSVLCMFFTNSTKVYVMRVGVYQEKVFHSYV
jgi:hypothetical protein